MFDADKRLEPTDEMFHPLVERLCEAHAHPTNPPVIKADSVFHNENMKWVVVGFAESIVPAQGWKLHVSAQSHTAAQVLEKVVPILVRHQIPFKCAPTRLKLQGLNQGEGGMTQIGKFMTIYPLTDEQAVLVAREMDEATRGIEGVLVPSDRPLAPDSLVSYRYGAFGSFQVQSQMGQIFYAIRQPDGSYAPDQRGNVYRAPKGYADPFEAAGIVTPMPKPKRMYGGRFLHISTIYHAPRNTIHLTVDIQHGQRAMLKQVPLKMRVGSRGHKAADLLRNEAQVLQAVGHDPRFPTFYAMFESDEHLFLAMEDVEATTFERHISGLRAQHRLPTTSQVAQWGKEIASMLEVMHTHGWVHRDLKSTNVLVTPTGTLRLIDFDISTPTGAPGWGVGFGTRGYMSPQQAEGAATTIADDIYGLGGLLFFAATLSETSQSPNVRNLLERPVALMNPQIHPELSRIIARCLATDPTERYATAAEVEADLALLNESHNLPLDFMAQTNHADSREADAEAFKTHGVRLAETLMKVAKPILEGAGLAWSSTHGSGAGIRSREINIGSSGALYPLIEFADKLGLETYGDAVARGAHWLTIAPRISEPIVPGLYVGEAGIAAALLRAGQVLQDQTLIDTALERANETAAAPLSSPDLFNGVAGRLRLHLWAWRVTGDTTQLDHAKRMGDFLVEQALGAAEDMAYWTIPQGLDGLSGHTQIGYSHGAAGIADTLLDLYEATGELRYRTTVERAARWVLSQGVEVLDGAGLAWGSDLHTGEGPIPYKSGFWCHGAAGIALFLVRGWKSGVLPDALESAEKAARAVAFGTRWSSPSQCHGLAGNIDVLLTLYQATGNSTYLDHAYDMGRLMMAYVQERDGLWISASENAGLITPDYMVGYAGIAVTFLRLSMPDTFLHPFLDETIGAAMAVPVPA